MYGLRAVREVTADRSMLGDNARLIRESGQISESATLKIQIGMFGAMAIYRQLTRTPKPLWRLPGREVSPKAAMPGHFALHLICRPYLTPLLLHTESC